MGCKWMVRWVSDDKNKESRWRVSNDEHLEAAWWRTQALNHQRCSSIGFIPAFTTMASVEGERASSWLLLFSFLLPHASIQPACWSCDLEAPSVGRASESSHWACSVSSNFNFFSPESRATTISGSHFIAGKEQEMYGEAIETWSSAVYHRNQEKDCVILNLLSSLKRSLSLLSPLVGHRCHERHKAQRSQWQKLIF